MHDDARVRQVAQQFAGTTGVIEVDMGQDQPVDMLAQYRLRLEFRRQRRHGMIGADVDEGTMAALDDQVDDVKPGSVKACVDRRDAMEIAHVVRSPC